MPVGSTMATTTVVRRVQNYRNMFSESARAPSHEYVLKQVPDRYANHRGRDAPRSTAEAIQDMNATQPSGQDRALFFHQPVNARVGGIPPSVVIRPTQNVSDESLVAAVSAPKKKKRPKSGQGSTRTVGVQTVYRDGEAQTDPFTPDYYIQPGAEAPEVLSIAALSYGQGLPAGLREVEMIERMRIKRRLEHQLPVPQDPDSFAQRRQMLEDIELQEWVEREKEIQALQDARMALLRKALQEREDALAASNQHKLDTVYAKRVADKDKKLATIQRKRVATLRKLSDTRKSVHVDPAKSRKRDIVKDYGDYASDVYAPRTRLGKSHRVRHAPVNHEVYQNLDMLDRLEALSIPIHGERELHAPSRVPNRALNPTERKQRRVAEQLDHLGATIAAGKAAGAGGKVLSPDGFPSPREVMEKHRIAKPPPRPPTPSIHADTRAPAAAGTAAAKRAAAIILLQRLLRGRAVQNAMYRGKERRRALVDELRTAETMRQAMQDAEAEKKAAAAGGEEGEGELGAQGEQIASALVANAQGASLAKGLSLLADELERARTQRRIAAMVKLAERARRMREAEEAGRRREEEARRDLEDHRFRLAMGVHDTTVDSWLESIAGEVAATEGENRAVKDVRAEVDALNNVVDKVEEAEDAAASNPETDKAAARATVLSLMVGFLLPEVQRESARQETRRLQAKYRKAVLDSLEGPDNNKD